MNLNPRTEAQRAALALAVGHAMSQWAMLETHLARLFAVSINMPLKDACKLLVHVKTFTLLLDLVDSAVKIKLGDMPSTRWHSLVEYIRELSGDRNYMAHTPTIFHGAGDPNTIDWNNGVTALIGPTMFAHFADARGRKPMGVTEANELTHDMAEATEVLVDYIVLVESVPASKEKLGAKISRRRPPRKQRQGSALQTP